MNDEMEAHVRMETPVRGPRDYEPVDHRTIVLAALAVGLAVAAALAAAFRRYGLLAQPDSRATRS